MNQKVFIPRIIVACIAMGIATAAIAGWMDGDFHPITPELPDVELEGLFDNVVNNGVGRRNEEEPEEQDSEAADHSASSDQAGDDQESGALPVVRLTRSSQEEVNGGLWFEGAVADEEMTATGGFSDDDLEMDGAGDVVEMITVPLSSAQEQQFELSEAQLRSLGERVESFRSWLRRAASRASITGAYTDNLFEQLALQNLAVILLPGENGGNQFYVVCVHCRYYLGAPEQVLDFYLKQKGRHSHCFKKVDEQRDAPTNRRYLSENTRISSYVHWPHEDVKGQSRSDMASAGYYFTGSGDCVRCYHCDVGAVQWRPGDVPLYEHYRWNPGCPFLLKSFEDQSLRQALIEYQNAQFRFPDPDQGASRIPRQQRTSGQRGHRTHPAAQGREGRNSDRNTIDRKAIESNISSMGVAGVTLDLDLLSRVITRNPVATDDQIVDFYLKEHENKPRQTPSDRQGQSTGTVRNSQEGEVAVRAPSRPLEHQAQSDRSSVHQAAGSSTARKKHHRPEPIKVEKLPKKRLSNRNKQSNMERPVNIINRTRVQIGRNNVVILSQNQDAPDIINKAEQSLSKTEKKPVDHQLLHDIVSKERLGESSRCLEHLINMYRATSQSQDEEDERKKREALKHKKSHEEVSESRQQVNRAEAHNLTLPEFLREGGLIMSRFASKMRETIESKAPVILSQFRQNNSRDPAAWEFYQELLNAEVVRFEGEAHSEAISLALITYSSLHAGADRAVVFSRIVNYEVEQLKKTSCFPSASDILNDLKENDRLREARR